MRLAIRCIAGLLLLVQHSLYAQSDLHNNELTQLPEKYFLMVSDKITTLQDQLFNKIRKYLHRFKRKELELQRLLIHADSSLNQQFRNTGDEYNTLIEELSNPLVKKAGNASSVYLPYVDSLKTTLAFLQQHEQLFNTQAGIGEKAQTVHHSLEQFQARLQQAESIKGFVRKRKQLLKEALTKHSKLPKHLANRFASWNQELYYYSDQINQYKELLNDPGKLEKKALSLLNKLPAFQEFIQKNGQLAGLFSVPANYGTPQSLAGLQTRAQVQQLIQNQLASVGPNAQQVLQQNLQAAQAQLSQLKDKIAKWGNSGADIDNPDFKPNNQRTKTFFQRLEYGTNIQTAKSNYFWPTTTDLGLSVGYKLSDKSTIGLGASYKMGWGKDIRHIVVTNEGVGFRSFADLKLKGSFYASGGFEYNYQQPFGSLAVINDLNKWQQSGLVGVSKVISIKNKFFKKTKVQLLWDFLSYQQVPQTQAVKFRVGYNF